MEIDLTGLILPGGIGIFGALAAMMLMLAATLAIALAPAARAPPESLNVPEPDSSGFRIGSRACLRPHR